MTASHPPTAPESFRITRVEKPPEPEWDRLLEVAPEATFFHRPAWSEVYARHHAGETVFLHAEADGRFVGGLPAVRFRRGPFHYYESLPMGTHGGPLVDPTFPAGEAVARALVDRFRELGQARLCLRVQCVIRDGTAVERHRGFTTSPIHLLSTDQGFDHFWMKVFPRNRRNECNRAAKRGVRVSTQFDPRHLEAFLPLHQEAHRRWGLPPHPEGFFHDIARAEPERTIFFSVFHEDSLLGAHLSFISGRELVAWHGVTRREGSRTFFPSSMIVKAEAEEADRRGLAAINLGGSGGHDGVESFKKLVGGHAEDTAVLERESSLLTWFRRLRHR